MIADALAPVPVSLALFAGALAITLAFELAVAALFHVGRRVLAAVACVNLITNPLFNLTVLVVLFTAGLGFGRGTWVTVLSVPVLEVVVVIVEWRLLVWALRDAAGGSRRMLALSITMNLASAVGGAVVWAGIGTLTTLVQG